MVHLNSALHLKMNVSLIHTTLIDISQAKYVCKICCVHVVLSTLYQEKMVTEEELNSMKPVEWIWPRLVQIQCTKPPHVVARTAKLLTEERHNAEKDLLKGQ